MNFRIVGCIAWVTFAAGCEPAVEEPASALAPTSLSADCQALPRLSLARQVELMRADVVRLEPAQRAGVRYVSLADVSNRGVCGAAFADHRATVQRLINSISTRGDIAVLPEVQASLGTVLRVQLPLYNLHQPLNGQPSKWAAIVHGPGFHHAFLPEGDDADELIEATASAHDAPFLESMALLEFASRADGGRLYYDLVAAPLTLSALQQQFGVNLDGAAAAQALDGDGALATQQRRIALHLGAGGRLVGVLDEASGTVFENPLDLQANTDQIIYTLPNGLQAYAMYDAGGLLVADDNILGDPRNSRANQLSGVAGTARACGGCLGSTPIRPFAPAPGAGHGAVLEAIRRANERYATAATQLGFEPGRAPAFDAVRAYAQPLGLPEAAAELGLAPTWLERQLAELDPILARALEGASVKRDVWDATFADLVVALGLGRHVLSR